MGIVTDIVNGAVDDSVKLATLLRKLLIVGDSLNNESLKEWVLHELNGYDNKDQLPVSDDEHHGERQLSFDDRANERSAYTVRNAQRGT